MGATDISIHRFASVYCTAQGQGAGLRLRDRLDGVLRRSISHHIEALCGPLLQGDDETVWLIRRLEIDCTVNGAWDDEQIARAWAQQVVSALATEMATGGAHVLRFDNEAAYLARFVLDLASGDAWSKWYYRRFAGLAALPSSGAIRSALVQAQATAVATLRSLDPAERARVLDALSPEDALLVLRMCGILPDQFSLEQVAPIAVAHARAAGRYAPSDPRWALEVFISSAHEADGGGAALLAAVAGLAVQVLRRAAPDTVHALPPWVETLGGLQALAALPRDVLAAALAHRPDTINVRDTAFGAAFLLLPLLFELPLEDWVQGWPDLGQLSADAALRALLLGKCLGGARSISVLGDPLWSELLALPDGVDWHETSRALSRLGAPARRGLRARLETQAKEQGASATGRRTARAQRRAWHIEQDELGYWHRLLPAHGSGFSAKADPDLDYLALAPALPLGAAWDGVLSLAAQQLLRRFARRLPGFGLSHFDYLHRNFLAMAARVEREGEHYVVHLSRPPLALMLNLTSMTRTEYELPWHPGHTCALFAEDSGWT
jgi:hypothetical protein